MIRDASTRDDRPDSRRKLPSVNAVLEMPGMPALLARAPRASVVDAGRAAIESARASEGDGSDDAAWVSGVDRELTRIVFFQAEDGIRAGTVTGVQTCALPI